MKAQLEAMLQLQEKMNAKVHPQWRQQGFAWHRAIWTECAELMDHYGWKWWKKQSPDLAEIKLELVDIWHFGMSSYLQYSENVPGIANRIRNAWAPMAGNRDFREIIESLVLHTLSERTLSIPLFAAALQNIGMSFDDLYRHYIGKNVLNFFRQDHGYKEGTYIKTWNGLEDNAHLSQILMSEDAGAADFQERVYAALKARYPG